MPPFRRFSLSFRRIVRSRAAVHLTTRELCLAAVATMDRTSESESQKINSGMEPGIEGPALWGTAEDCEPRPGRSVAWRRGSSGRPVLHRAALRLCRIYARG